MKTVSKIKQITDNIHKLNSYARSTNKADQKFHREIIGRGRVFIAVKYGDRILFGPSRFVGYAKNNIDKHNANEGKDGRETNKILEPLLNPLISDDSDDYANIDAQFLSYCKEFDITPVKNKKLRRYYIIGHDTKKMSRKQFITLHGGECANWQWSWSFVNHKQKFVIFGLWNYHENDELGTILNKDWQFREGGKKINGYGQALEHINLIRDNAYKLFTFPMTSKEEGSVKIDNFVPELNEKQLITSGKNWYAANLQFNCEPDQEIRESDKSFKEGAVKSIIVNQYERNPKARQACLDHYGYQCSVCEFNFEDVYGELGKQYIHVHHLKMMSEIKDEYEIDPIKDLIPVCPNCHGIIHRTRPHQTIEEMKNLLQQ